MLCYVADSNKYFFSYENLKKQANNFEKKAKTITHGFF